MDPISIDSSAVSSKNIDSVFQSEAFAGKPG